MLFAKDKTMDVKVQLKGAAGHAVFKKENQSIHTFTDLPLGLASLVSSETTLDDQLQSTYLKPNQKSALLMKHSQRFVDKPVEYSCLSQLNECSRVHSNYACRRNQLDGVLDLGTFDKSLLEESGLTAENSSSLKREPAPQDSFVRGKSTFRPFQFGGFDGGAGERKDNIMIDQELDLSPESLFSTPPGFERGIDFSSEQDQRQLLHIQDLFSAAIDASFSGFDESGIDDGKLMVQSNDNEKSELLAEKDIDSFLPVSNSISLVPTRPPKTQHAREWVHMVDINLDFPEFYDLVPELAQNFSFELDVFQKRAIYHLELSESVFVAAHTSAGKTVVAEYAISLAMKHMTRAVYTSPIKALSNQKYRDFKEKFSDVGILTGDIQIKPEAACLIMTTEILRSMLYRGADLIRDVEFVIFDEVHYLNDAERGD